MIPRTYKTRESMVRPFERKRARRGLTLIELLITLAVATLLAAIVLPSVKSLIADRKSSQSAILIRNYLEAARTRAIGSGRPVAVVLERLSSRANDANGNGRIEGAEIGVSGTANPVGTSTDPIINYATYNSCIRMSIAEVPQATTSDMLGIAVGSVVGEMEAPFFVSGVPVNVPGAPIIQGYRRVGIFPTPTNTQTIQLLMASEGTGVAVLRNPVEITVGLSGTKHMVSGVARTVVAGLDFFVLYIRTSNFVPFPGALAADELSSPPSDVPGQSLHPITFYSRPKTIAYQNLELPKGMCIDLSLSGFDENRFIKNRDSVGPVDGDYRLRFSSDWVSPLVVGTGAIGEIPEPSELRPIYLVFSPTGTLSRVYANYESVPTQPPFSSLEVVDVVDDIYLHVGKIDQVIFDPTAGAAPFAGNLIDSSSYIVRVSASSGAITASPTGAIRPEDFGTELNAAWASSALTRVSDIGEFVALARRRAFGQTVTAQ